MVRGNFVKGGKCNAHDTCELLILDRLVARLLIFETVKRGEESTPRQQTYALL